MATLADLQTRLAAYRKAEDAILIGGQATEFTAGSLSGRKLTRANLGEVRAAIADLECRIALLTQPMHGNVVFGGRR